MVGSRRPFEKADKNVFFIRQSPHHGAPITSRPLHSVALLRNGSRPRPLVVGKEHVFVGFFFGLLVASQQEGYSRLPSKNSPTDDST
jgi:hypothetical protein